MMDFLWFIGLIALWYVINRWILSRLGVQT
jgi:hypothetical protein